MRGQINVQPTLFSYVDLASRTPKQNPIRRIQAVVDTALEEMEDTFETTYADIGRPSIPPRAAVKSLAAPDLSHDSL